MQGEKYQNLSQLHCDTHLLGPLMRTKMIQANREKGRKAQGLHVLYPNLLLVIHILWKTLSKLEALQVFKLGTFPYIKYQHNASEVSVINQVCKGKELLQEILEDALYVLDNFSHKSSAPLHVFLFQLLFSYYSMQFFPTIFLHRDIHRKRVMNILGFYL